MFVLKIKGGFLIPFHHMLSSRAKGDGREKEEGLGGGGGDRKLNLASTSSSSVHNLKEQNLRVIFGKRTGRQVEATTARG